MRRYGAWMLLSALLASCAGGPEVRTPAPQLGVSWLSSVESEIQQGQFGEAYQTVSFLERKPADGVSAEKLAELKSRIASGLADSFQDKIRRRDYAEALARFDSLAVMGQAVPDWSRGRLLASVATERAAQQELPVAFLYALQAMNAGERGAEFLNLALHLASVLGNSPVYEKVADLLRQAGLPLPADAGPKPAGQQPVDKMVRGTVTIWVNKGIKIEKGVGVPDRVIGSGFFIDPRGYLLTNYHVIESEVDPKYEGYSRLFVRPSDRVEARIPAKVVGYDRIFDLALVKAELTPEYVFSSAEDPEMKVGSPIMAIGSPAGLENTVTSGIVSATGRRFLQMGDAVQVDVPVNPGNSGGPLLDSSGQLVGVVFAGIEQFQGVNFVIPYSWANKVLPELYRGGEAIHPWLGMAVQETDKGLEVLYTLPGGPADSAGLEAGDLLVSLNGAEYRKLGRLQGALLELEPGSLVSLSWKRGSETQSGFLALEKRPFSPLEEALAKDRRERVMYPMFGMMLSKTGTFLWRDSYVVERVLPGSVADETGLSEGDPLTIQAWKVNEEQRYALVQIVVKKRKSGFLESAVQMASYLETDNFI